MANQTRATKYADALNIFSGKFAATDKMRMYKSTFTPTQNSTRADFFANEVAFTGYAAVVMAAGWNPGLDMAGNPQLIYLGLPNFFSTGSAATDIAGGWWIEDTAGTEVLLFNPFDTPLQFDSNGDSVLIKPSETFTEESAADVEYQAGP